MMDWNGHNMSTGGWIFSGLAIILLLALVAAAIAWTAREFRRREQGPAALSARDILDGRLARGEIKVEQYEQLRQTLGLRPDASVESRPPRPATVSG